MVSPKPGVVASSLRWQPQFQMQCLNGFRLMSISIRDSEVSINKICVIGCMKNMFVVRGSSDTDLCTKIGRGLLREMVKSELAGF